ncbi:sensor histidine kinase [Idiomarina seosinensis]|uniref:histidine kinase n=1 Tax=Idiomarina seosinensis TaxID=281739 RepID=A0A432ZG91_9GAMM|nr:ATP-binding protein [Idiomarina seosinensis]RUO77015.1 histidine kinase [Idiomarina seosinensis]
MNNKDEQWISWPVMAIELDLDGRVITWISAAFAEHFRRTPEQLIGSSLDQLLTMASRLYFLSALDAPLRQGKHCEQHTLYLNGPKGELPYLTNARPYYATGARLVFMAADQHLMLQQQLIQERDYTETINRELKQRQQQLITQREQQKAALDKLEDVNHEMLQTEKLAAIGQLAAGIAHEINNPVGYIQSNLNTLGYYTDKLLALVDGCKDENLAKQLRQQDYDYLKTDMTELLQESNEGIQHITNITSALTQFTRRSGFAEECDLQQQINTTLRVLQNEFKQKARIQRKYCDKPCWVVFDPAQLNQVLMNVLMNAVQAMKNFGDIVIETETDGELATITITDSGTGMSEETARRSTEPFFTTKPEGEGTGLGLSLVYNIVRRHNGTLKIISEIGKGTSVIVSVPLAQRHPSNKSITA